ncbi:hypothetical protein EDD85DRAFT_947996 [Armillaria nabsnona]|nr:hypothetical protein EDD85DRAFT_947996 [Armillaria nabsnona]
MAPCLQGRSATRKKASGPKITKTDVLNIFNLKEWDLRSLTYEVKPHPKYKGKVMHLYDREEDEAIAKRVYGSSYKSPATQSRRRYPPAGQGRYDGLSREDAAELFCRDTGIVDSAAFGSCC